MLHKTLSSLAHPRMRGEGVSTISGVAVTCGSSPHARGGL